MKAVFDKKATVLFYGDSITDTKRSRTDLNDLGKGYAAKAPAIYQALFPEQEVRFLNRGVSGNASADLLVRYERDLLALHPDVVSIMIGINDTWHGWHDGHTIPHEVTEERVRKLVEQIRRDLPEAKIIMLEPYLLDSDPEKVSWHEDFEPKRERIRKVGLELADWYVDLPKVFEAAMCSGVTQEEITADGVHPTDYGHGLIAQAWLKVLGVLD